MSTATPGSAALVWPSGVGGAQCEDCGETTIVRTLGDWEDGEHLLCRECVEGDAGESEYDRD